MGSQDCANLLCPLSPSPWLCLPGVLCLLVEPHLHPIQPVSAEMVLPESLAPFLLPYLSLPVAFFLSERLSWGKAIPLVECLYLTSRRLVWLWRLRPHWLRRRLATVAGDSCWCLCLRSDASLDSFSAPLARWRFVTAMPLGVGAGVALRPGSGPFEPSRRRVPSGVVRRSLRLGEPSHVSSPGHRL